MPSGQPNIQLEIDHLQAGDTFKFGSLEIDKPLVLRGLRGTQANPIRLIGQPAKKGTLSQTVFRGEYTYESYKDLANKLSRAHEAGGDYPGLGYLAQSAAIYMVDCQWVILEHLSFVDCWPTAIYIDNSQHLELRHLHFRGGTFAIGADGRETRHLLIEDCDWIQDPNDDAEADIRSIHKENRVPLKKNRQFSRLYREISWERIHRAFSSETTLVDVTESADGVHTDERIFDGDFFRAWTIRGYVILRNNIIVDAFNGIHSYNHASNDIRPNFNRHFLIENNWFVRIRDNAIEPENHFRNWTARHNCFVDCFAAFSIEPEESGYLYIYGNLSWAHYRPGPGISGDNGLEKDDRLTGRHFKWGSRHQAFGPHYILYNTWFARASHFKKKRFSGLIHANNVVGYNEEAEEFNPEAISPFGVDWNKAPTPTDALRDPRKREKNRFTKAWEELNIIFDGDMIGQEDFPSALRAAGYGLGPASSGTKPEFVSTTIDKDHGLKLKNAQPAIDVPIFYPDYNASFARATQVDGSNYVVGAWQKDGLFTLPDPLFVSYWQYALPFAPEDKAEGSEDVPAGQAGV